MSRLRQRSICLICLVRVVWATLALATTPACSDGETALRLRLLADPSLNTEQQVLAAVQSVQLVLDAAGGFSGVSGAGQQLGPLTAKDVDADGTLELMLARDITPSGDLPLFRLLPGRNASRTFRLTVQGLRGEQIAAIGGLSTAAFSPGEALDLLVPFNLRPAFLPPNVLITLPHDGQGTVPQALDRVYVEFSKQVATPTVDGNLRLLYEGNAGAVPVPGRWSLGTTDALSLGLTEKRSTATLQIECTLSPGTYRLEATPAISDPTGTALDQDAVKAGNDAYVGRFTIPGSTGSEPCTKRQEGCTDSRECNPTTADRPATGDLFVCQSADGSGIRKCTPVPQTCETLRCPDGHVCQQVRSDSNDVDCVPDCRQRGTCATSNAFCDKQTGECIPCDAAAGQCQPPPDEDCKRQCEQFCAQSQLECEKCMKERCNV